MKKGFKRYQISFPFEGKSIYETRSLARAADKGYREVISRGISGNIFSLLDIDNKIEYCFEIDRQSIINGNVSENSVMIESNVNEKLGTLDEIPKIVTLMDTFNEIN